MKKAFLLTTLLFVADTALAQAEEPWPADDGYETQTAGTAEEGQSGALTQTVPAGEKESIWNLRFGAKGGVTGNLWAAPEEVPIQYGDLGHFWADDQFFVGGGGGLFVEANFFRYLGLELDLLFESNALTFNQTFTIGGLELEYDYNTTFTQLRIPLLVKGVLPLGDVAEMSLGLGPEFVVGLDADVEVDFITDVSLFPQVASNFAAVYQAEKADGTFFDFDLGLSFKAWKLVIPVSIRACLNLDQPPEYANRVTLQGPPAGVTRATVKAVESYHFALLLGLGYLLSP